MDNLVRELGQATRNEEISALVVDKCLQQVTELQEVATNLKAMVNRKK